MALRRVRVNATEQWPYASLMTMYIKASIPLTCTYDSVADAAYIYLEHPTPPGAVERMLSFDAAHGMFNLDLNAAGHVLGLEIIGARAHLPPALLEAILKHAPDQDA